MLYKIYQKSVLVLEHPAIAAVFVQETGKQPRRAPRGAGRPRAGASSVGAVDCAGRRCGRSGSDVQLHGLQRHPEPLRSGSGDRRERHNTVQSASLYSAMRWPGG